MSEGRQCVSIGAPSTYPLQLVTKEGALKPKPKGFAVKPKKSGVF